ncbi:L-cysteine desulfidase family protein [Sutterella sp.]|uniref:L-cysteine desulfidase family protein n=1 Tax=Sutterella sp. TaxID=1981025 RepID=UPI003FD7EF36
MNDQYTHYRRALIEELQPAMGCTEPIALAYAAAEAGRRLGGYPEEIEVEVSRNIVKNVKSVIVPNTGGLYGIEAAVAAGFVARRPEAKLQVLAEITDAERAEIGRRVKEPMVVRQSNEPDVFFIRITGRLNGRTDTVTIRTYHTNITCIEEDGHKILSEGDRPQEERTVEKWRIADLIAAARVMPLDDLEPCLAAQIEKNLAIAREGLSKNWGCGIGRVLLSRTEVETPLVLRARAWAAAGSDARMNGCELPVVIVSGSGNQGITASVPVAVYAQGLGVPHEKLLRGVLLSDLITVALKQGIGKLSAYCGAVSAGCGAGAGIAYLMDCTDEEIEKVISNALAISSGLLCDGAKSSCAAKISMSVEGAILALDMVKNDCAFRPGDGIVQETTDDTAAAVGRIASRGMVGTDREIIRVMLGES